MESFFSVSLDLILKDQPLPYALYVNSSSIEKKQKFVKISQVGNSYSESDLKGMQKKYFQLYLIESDRGEFMRSLVNSEQISDAEATSIIKDTAIKHLHNIFDSGKEFNTELLSETIEASREVVEGMVDVLDDYNIDSLRGLIGDLSGHDFYTYDHSINVSMYCITILRSLNPNATRIELIHVGLGGLLHDLGKVKIPTHILNSPGGLTEEEYQVIKKHPDYGVALLKSGQCEVDEDLNLDILARIIHEHHENWNGTGYPAGLKENEISLFARVCAIADFFDAVTTKRSYSEVLPISQALDVMEKTAGKKLDPQMFKIFSNNVKHSKVKSLKDLTMREEFDPSIPWENLPLDKTEKKEDGAFGKITFVDEDDKNKKKKKSS